MTEIKDGLLYTEEHEWVRLEGDTAVMGITDYAQSQLGDIAYVDLPETGKEVSQSAFMCDIESVKAVSDIFAPVSGTVLAANRELDDSPELINTQPYEAWIVKIKMSNKEELKTLLDAASYKVYVEKESAKK